MSSGKFKPHRGFNKTQIKDGWIVRLRKDGTIASKLGRYGKNRNDLRDRVLYDIEKANNIKVL